MSRIYFHTRDEGEAELRGSERAHMGLTCEKITKAFLPYDAPVEQIRELTDPQSHHMLDHYAKQRNGDRRVPREDWRIGADDLGRLWFGMFGDGAIRYQGGTISGFTVGLNTTLAVGDDPLRLFARLHGQCEIHAFIEGPNRAVVAKIMDRGLDSGLYRRDQGWEKVIDFLVAADDAPVVTSYSVTDGFPNAYVSDWESPEDDEDHEAWYELPEGQRWDLSMSALRRQSAEGMNLEIIPDELATYRFGRTGCEPTIFDVLGELA